MEPRLRLEMRLSHTLALLSDNKCSVVVGKDFVFNEKFSRKCVHIIEKLKLKHLWRKYD